MDSKANAQQALVQWPKEIAKTKLNWAKLSPFFICIFLLNDEEKTQNKEANGTRTKIEWLKGGESKV